VPHREKTQRLPLSTSTSAPDTKPGNDLVSVSPQVHNLIVFSSG
jgi:hypothetical protein